jgi:hypothetical protein
MTTDTNQKATILKPGSEYTDYCSFCKKKNFEQVSETEFYKGLYILALRLAIIEDEEEGVATYDFGDVTALFSEVDNKGIVLAAFETAQLKKWEDKATAEETDPTKHLG